ncbi:Modification methylase [Candidatus Nitrosotalea okcheonensis]|uniref:DNA (cytosine-5-)-methyltransferase n=1 Tax=Candidatus Nitrosotalea okcheonensis TaxID=1903276 RepID=A0A2H1FIL0_9ARCH|nr:DNA (cytosine-5-)-methyltransferase [Candidatus Nitrosotalea okcheonensis]SMH72601.1 Modification methylase [Candidatus Nitrosotalea okcheonensis]
MKKDAFTFIDLFAGIGGMRLAFERAGGRCVFSSEWNKFSQQTYEANFGEVPEGDITNINENDIPDHDILAGGFPCQPFSIAGVSKKQSLNRPHGFEDETQGTLFFDIARILKAKRPKAFLLENVKNLQSHDKGKTLKIILKTLRDHLGYDVHYKIMDAKVVVPQHRERIFIVGFSEPTEFSFPEIPDRKLIMHDILESKVDKKYTLTKGVWNALQRHAANSKAKGNGFGYGMTNLDGISRTLSARYYKDGSEVLIPQKNNPVPRRLTPRECARLMGFPESFKIVVSDSQAYRQFGNALVVPLVEEIAKSVVECVQSKKRRITIADYT